MTFVFESPEIEGRPDPWGLRSPGGGDFMLYRDMLPVDANGTPAPSFDTGEVAKIFFGKSSAWLKWMEGRTGHHKGKDKVNRIVLDGHPVVPVRVNGFRRYTLVDVERMAHALAQGGTIGGERLISILTVVKHIAILNGVNL